MAQPVEIPFSVVRDHAAVRHLNAAAFGAYSFLVMAALWDGVNLAEQNDASLALITRSHMTTWLRQRKAILKALSDSLPLLRARYQNHAKSFAAFRQRQRAASEKGQLSLARKRELRKRAISFVQEPLTAPMILQPHKREPFSSQSTDLPALRALEKRIKSTPKGKTLAETKT